MDAARRSSKEPSDETSATQSSSIAARQGITRPCNTFLALATMRCSVACSAQRDQVGLGVGSQMAAELPVVHLKIRRRATGLTPPAVATQDLLAQTFEFLARRFPESRRKAYYLMSIHEHLPPQARKDLNEVGWTKGLELAKLARRDGRHFDCATWLHKAREMPKEG